MSALGSVWAPEFAIVNVYRWKSELFQVRCAKLKWLGQGEKEVLQHLCQPPGTPAETLVPSTWTWDHLWDRVLTSLPVHVYVKKKKSLGVKAFRICTCEHLPRIQIIECGPVVAL